MIEGKNIIVRKTGKEDLEYIQRLWNNGEVMKWVGFPEGLNITMDKIYRWHEYISNNKNTNSFVVLHSVEGFCGELFYEIDEEHKRAGLDIKFLPESQGKGLASESLKLLINYIFENEEVVEAVWTEPSPTNESARKLYSKCGLSSKERPTDMEPAESYWELSREEWKQL